MGAAYRGARHLQHSPSIFKSLSALHFFQHPLLPLLPFSSTSSPCSFFFVQALPAAVSALSLPPCSPSEIGPTVVEASLAWKPTARPPSLAVPRRRSMPGRLSRCAAQAFARSHANLFVRGCVLRARARTCCTAHQR